jgi:hypothetical protein
VNHFIVAVHLKPASVYRPSSLSSCLITSSSAHQGLKTISASSVDNDLTQCNVLHFLADYLEPPGDIKDRKPSLSTAVFVQRLNRPPYLSNEADSSGQLPLNLVRSASSSFGQFQSYESLTYARGQDNTVTIPATAREHVSNRQFVLTQADREFPQLSWLQTYFSGVPPSGVVEVTDPAYIHRLD